jgi:ADP-ribose pyrophosphatase YjhB (NUDIX family)
MLDPRSASIRHCARCGGSLRHQHRDGRERPVCTDCGAVVYLDPKVACGVLVMRRRAILLVQRRNEPGRGLWCLPCGFADADEAPEAAAAREAFEETGLRITIGALVGAYHYRDDPRGAGILLVYRGRAARGVAQAHDDAAAVGWFALDGLPPLSHAPHRLAIADATRRTRRPLPERTDSH